MCLTNVFFINTVYALFLKQLPYENLDDQALVRRLQLVAIGEETLSLPMPRGTWPLVESLVSLCHEPEPEKRPSFGELSVWLAEKSWMSILRYSWSWD